MSSDIAFKIGPVVVHWYGLLIFIGAIAGGYVAIREARRYNENPEHVWDGLVWCLILGFIGARLYHIFSSPADGSRGFSSYAEDPIAIFTVWDGGLGVYGAIAGGMLGLLIYARRNRLNAWRWLDIGAPGLILAQAIGRWGNFLNQELYGPPTTLPWGLRIDADHRIPQYSDLAHYPVETTRFHPTFLYESLWNLGVFVLLMWLGRRWAARLHNGDVFLAYLVLYPLGRLWIEQFFRPDAWTVGEGLPTATVISLVVGVLAGVGIWVRHRNEAE